MHTCAVEMLSTHSYCLVLLHPFQIVGRLIFSTPSLTTRLIQKFVQNIIFLLWLALLIQVLEEWFKFNYVCIIFLNKMSGQTWCQKSQTTYNLEWREYILDLFLLCPCSYMYAFS